MSTDETTVRPSLVDLDRMYMAMGCGLVAGMSTMVEPLAAFGRAASNIRIAPPVDSDGSTT